MKKLFGKILGITTSSKMKVDWADCGEYRRRKYKSYEHYLAHQGQKLHSKYGEIEKSDAGYERIIYERYRDNAFICGKKVICLGARLGGEVRAFKRLGALAIGVDVEPGMKNAHVLWGDVHNLQFPDGAFDVAFTNIVDHLFDVERFVRETWRILNEEGMLIVEATGGGPGQYESIDLTSIEKFWALFENNFGLVSETPIYNKTDYINWRGTCFVFKKLCVVKGVVV